MAAGHCVETVTELAERFARQQLHRPMCIGQYEAGAESVYDVTGVAPARPARVRLVIERFVGGGFAGQVYRVRIAEIDAPQGPIEGIQVGGTYAMKILVPPSGKARWFRDCIYRLGFQAPFSLQVNPAAARAGALWQKFIRRAAAVRFGDARAVVDVLGTFVDSTIGSCGEISEWVDGRTWRYEVDDRLFARWRWKVGSQEVGPGSPEYCAKKRFMAEFVELLHEMGAPELARQYEWWTCKSQPNVLKRLDCEDDPAAGLTAVDFRAGLALLPCLPMSPGDVKLIFKGIARGSLVQFDRGDVGRLEAFVEAHGEDFADMGQAMEELKVVERQYRDSQIDIAHNHVRLLYSGRLWSTIFDSTVTGWRVRNIADESCASRLRGCAGRTILFAILGAMPLLGTVAAVALLARGLLVGWPAWPVVGAAAALALGATLAGKLLRRLWGRGDFRRHLRGVLTSAEYFRRAARGHFAETLIRWHRAGRVDGRRARGIADRPWLFLAHLPLSFLPAFAHRLLTDRRYALGLLQRIFVRPVRLYFNAHARERWLREMVAEGRRRDMLSDDDAESILARVKEPFIQKYLKSLAVHVCTLPITQIVSVAVAWIYVRTHPELSPKQVSLAVGAILVGFQLTPISPGSLVRGLYVLWLVIRERNFRDYNIAVFLGFFKYVGYLAFPIQMAYRYPALARFMAAHWATGAAHVVPVFGEHGALLEHGVFDLFYNYPLTVRRRMRARAKRRAALPERTWHAVPIVLAAVAIFAAADAGCRARWGALPTPGDVWPLTALVPLLIGAAVTIGAAGASLAKRIRLALVSGFATALGYGAAHAALAIVPSLGGAGASGEPVKELLKAGAWSAFLFSLLATVSALLTEINLPEPKPPRDES